MDIFGSLSKIIASIMAAVTGIASSVVPGIAQPQITPTPSSTNIVIQENMITRSGEIAYAGQSVSYIINIPQNGGNISGSVDGFCKGNITGIFNGVEGGNISGSANPSCGVAFLRKTFNISYSGALFLKQGRADLDWIGDIPSTPGKGSYTFNFEPEK